MLSAAKLAKDYKRNATIIKWQADSLSHADSLIQTPYRINCLNWVLGHVAEGRDGVLEMIGTDRVADPGELDRYLYESEPILDDGPGVVSLERLLESVLYGISPTDPLTLVEAGIVVLSAALAAGYLPARRATKIDPVEALRRE